MSKGIKFAILANLILTPCMRLGYWNEFPAPELGVLTCESRKRKQSNKPALGDGVTHVHTVPEHGAAG